MDWTAQFDEYLAHLSGGLGHADRVAHLAGYCTGLMLPLARKSVEPMAARLDPHHASARHQALHHFVAKADWSDADLLRRVAQRVVPKMDFSAGSGFWLVDDTGFPKKGRHSVGVARQWCGALGKQDNCQVTVSVSLARERASLPVAWRLYLPEEWAADPERRAKAGMPKDIAFATKGEIALAQLQALLAEGAPRHCVVADAGYGTEAAFRARLTEMGLAYMAGVTSAVAVWPPSMEPLPPKPYSGHGRPPVATRRSPAAAGGEPRAVAAASSLHEHHVRGVRAPTTPLLGALPRCGCATPAASPPSSGCTPSSGCSLSDPRTRTSRATTGCPPCPKPRRWPSLRGWRTCAKRTSVGRKAIRRVESEAGRRLRGQEKRNDSSDHRSNCGFASCSGCNRPSRCTPEVVSPRSPGFDWRRKKRCCGS